MRQINRRGFTLVELLIVIGIITLLVAILLPAVNRAREMGRRTVCLSNVRQLTLAWLEYATDNKGRFCGPLPYAPTWTNGVTRVNSQWAWVGGDLDPKNSFDPINSISFPTLGKLWPYTKTLGIYTCPDDAQALVGFGESGGLLGRGSGISYGLNDVLGDAAIVNGTGVVNHGPAPLAQPIPIWYVLSQIRHPEYTAAFVETGQRLGGSPQAILPVYPNGMGAPVPTTDHGMARSGGASISFVDGHAIFFSYDTYTVGPRLNTGDPGFQWQALQLAAWSGGPIPPGVTP